MPNRVAAYCRVSTAKQSEDGVSIETQRDACRRYCELYNLELIETIEDPGYSGKNLKRPGMQRLLAQLRSGELDGVVVYDISRLSRSVGDTARLLDELFSEAGGRQLHSYSEAVNTTTPAGILYVNMLMAFSQFHRQQTVKKTKDALHTKKKNGQRVGNVLYGYTVDARDGRTLIEDPHQMQAISLMQHLRHNEEWSFRRIAAELDKQGFKSQSGQPWSASAVCRILKRQTAAS